MLSEKEQLEIKAQAKTLLEIAKNYDLYSRETIVNYLESHANKILKSVNS